MLVGCHRQSPAPTGPLFDVPALIGKTQNEIEKQLGTSTTKFWQKDGTKLSAQWSQSGFLTGIFIRKRSAFER